MIPKESGKKNVFCCFSLFIYSSRWPTARRQRWVHWRKFLGIPHQACRESNEMTCWILETESISNSLTEPRANTICWSHYVQTCSRMSLYLTSVLDLHALINREVINLHTIYCSANMYLGNIQRYVCILMNFIFLQRSQLLVLTITAMTW